MIWPTLCVDNFFNNPEEVKKYALSLEYSASDDGTWPGKRSKPLDKINFNFFKFVTTKIIRLLYPMNVEDLGWKAYASFQKIDGNLYSEPGWVHRDMDEFTAIIYLSHYENCGTSIFSPKNVSTEFLHESTKKQAYIKTALENKKVEDSKELIEHNSQFKKTITFNSIFNRLILFDCSQYHAAEKFHEVGTNEDRLTLIIFFENIISTNQNTIKLPIPQMNRFF
jgi:hypothetical protein